MQRLTKKEIAKVFEIDEKMLDGGTFYEYIKERERKFVAEVLKPWLDKLAAGLRRINER